MKKQITIIGAGVVGLCTAYYLHKKGHAVQIIEKGDGRDNCSFGNAGMVVPSHFVPLASPGMIAKGLRWMFNAESPFYIKPRLNRDLIQWAWLFYRHSNKAHVERSMQCLKDYNLLSKGLFQEMFESQDFDFTFEQKGLLMLCATEAGAQEEQELGALAERQGIKANWYAAHELKQLEPHLDLNVKGGLHFPGDAHLAPQEFMRNLRAYLEQVGVDFCCNEEVLDFEGNKNRLSHVITNKEKREVEELILAGGAWSTKLFKKLKINLPLQGGKGYSFETTTTTHIQIPTVLAEAKVAVTPMKGQTRFAGTMEINGLDLSINTKRVVGIQKAIARYYPNLQLETGKERKIWSGLRPCSPDGLPYLGRSSQFKNLLVGTGHAMMGLSMGPASGLLLSELVDEEKTAIDINLLQINRFE